MPIDEASKQLEEFSNLVCFLEKYGKMSHDVRDKMHGRYTFESNLKTQSCKYKKTFASCGVNFQNIVLLSMLC